jgi:uncharacterized protein YukE
LRRQRQKIPSAINQEKLNKVLALTKSEHDGEAFAAFRTAQRLLDAAGVSFADILADKATPILAQPKSPPTFEDAEELKKILRDTRVQLAKKAEEVGRHENQTAELSRQITVLQEALIQKTKETEGWRQRAWRIMWENSETH